MKHRPITYKYPKPERTPGLDKSEFKTVSLRPELELFVDFEKIEENRVSALLDSVFLARNYRGINNTGHQLLIMKFDAIEPKNMNTDAAPVLRPTEQNAVDQVFLDDAYQQHWSTRLVRAWAELRRIQRKLAEDTGADNTGHNFNA